VRQHELLVLVARGLTNKEIAPRLHITERGVAAAISRLLIRFETPNRAGLIARSLAELPELGSGLFELDYRRFDDSPYLVSVLSGPQLVLAYVNRRFEAVFGRSAVELVGRTVASALPHVNPQALAMARAVFEDGQPRTAGSLPARWQDAGGAWRTATFDLVQQALRGRSGDVVGVLEFAMESRAGAP